MYIVYILKSLKNGRHYIGHTANVEIRLAEHNSGSVRSTKAYVPWRIALTENYNIRSEAQRREFEIKSYKGGIKFKKLLGLPI